MRARCAVPSALMGAATVSATALITGCGLAAGSAGRAARLGLIAFGAGGLAARQHVSVVLLPLRLWALAGAHGVEAPLQAHRTVPPLPVELEGGGVVRDDVQEGEQRAIPPPVLLCKRHEARCDALPAERRLHADQADVRRDRFSARHHERAVDRSRATACSAILRAWLLFCVPCSDAALRILKEACNMTCCKKTTPALQA